MSQDDQGRGRPEITEEQKKEMLSNIEPYLKQGISVRKSLIEAQIPSATFYKLMERDEHFREQINRFRQFLSILLNTAAVRHLQGIIKKQNDNQPLAKEDVAYIQWYATNSNLTKEEFGERKDINLYDPEVEIQKVKGILEEQTTKEIKDA